MKKTPETPEFVTITIQDKFGTFVKEFRARRGTNLWYQLRKQGIPIGSACSGVGVCAACDVEIILPTDGSRSKIDEETEFEKTSKERNGVSSSRRLSCLMRVWSDLIVQKT